MGIEGKKVTTRGKIPKWESELWDYLGSGDGVRCPIYSRCQERLSGVWCPSDNLGYITQLLDDRRFDASKYDFIGGGGERCSGVFQLVERLAKDYLAKTKVHCPPVSTELVSLADEQHPVEVRLLPLKIYHGAVWYLKGRCRKGRWIIQLNRNAPPARRRFSLFHEAFHILAHCRATTPLFRKREHEGISFNELLADYFAGSILMPREWVREKWTEVEDLDSMAKIFDVPKPIMWLRLKEMGLV
jgi:hypothetical protein